MCSDRFLKEIDDLRNNNSLNIINDSISGIDIMKESDIFWSNLICSGYFTINENRNLIITCKMVKYLFNNSDITGF